MKTVRLGIAGLGSMGTNHAKKILDNQVPGAVLTAVADPFSDVRQFGPEVKGFTSSEEMIASGEIDAILIVTPHYSHTSLGIAALEKGLHVLVEKPISVHKADAERLLAAHNDPKQIFAAMFNVRTYPCYQALKQLIDSGELGEIRRVNWVITDWFRTFAYYNSASWRATWEGEGGGVLLNQCPHNLDMIQWLFGMPSRVRALCRFGHYHEIEVEDDVTAVLEYPNGATGVFIASTGESPGTNRLEITAENGRVVLEDEQIRWVRNTQGMSEFSRTTPMRGGRPSVWNVEIPLAPPNAASSHVIIMRNFINAILHGEEVIAPGAEGLCSVELANAMLMSQFTDSTITLPLDGAAYEKELAARIAESAQRRNNATPAPATPCK
ncbi:MAG TPA: Gfo/Idh/MocA family oxidoreductase [Chthoniobacteraceae bacterium]|nr:Gfo/Idh/MocA family oxidoreductase [Chthoniobacteraceae bacterium]